MTGLVKIPSVTVTARQSEAKPWAEMTWVLPGGTIWPSVKAGPMLASGSAAHSATAHEPEVQGVSTSLYSTRRLLKSFFQRP